MKKPMRFGLLIFIFGSIFCACSSSTKTIDTLLYNGTIYTVDSSFSVVEAVAISEGKILATGSYDSLRQMYKAKNELDLKGAFVYPGFIDAHCHFFGYGSNASQLDLRDVKSLEELEKKVKAFAVDHPDGWIVGRGWNEENWDGSKLVHNAGLNEMFPNRPICLQRVDGHSLLANKAALDKGGFTAETEIAGGEVVLIDGEMSGVLVDNAANHLTAILPEMSDAQVGEALMIAQDHCFKEGLTTVADAGLELEVIQVLESLTGKDLQIRVYAMSNPNTKEFEYFEMNGPIDLPGLKVRSFKLYGDGSLGSKSAWLKKSYCGDKGNFGLPQGDTAYFREVCEDARELGFQLNTHCIGDSANAVLLRIYADVLDGAEDARWRIEHAQVVDPVDMPLFGELKVIPSVQPTHAISDMHMAHDRLCGDLTGAYAYKSLLKHAGIIAFGTDFPVEHISPLATFYTAVERKNDGGEEFEAQEALSRTDALKAMTIWAAYSCFMENEIGSIEEGKQADFTVLDTDLIQSTEIKNTQVLATFVSGKQVYKSH